MGVFVVVQCMRQYTENNPLVALQQSAPTLEAGGNTLYSAISPFLPDKSKLTVLVS